MFVETIHFVICVSRLLALCVSLYFCQLVQLTRLRISLTCYDELGYGWLREQDLENYVYDQLACLQPLSTLDRDFYPYYVFTAVRKFFFFLDTNRRGKLWISDLLQSSVMGEFDSLRYPLGSQGMLPNNNSINGTQSKRNTLASSWFSAQKTQDVYGKQVNNSSYKNILHSNLN